MSVSWDWTRDESWDKAELYEAEIRAADRERVREGWVPPMGFRRPVDPPCEVHGYGAVDGLCGVCLLELEARKAAA